MVAVVIWRDGWSGVWPCGGGYAPTNGSIPTSRVLVGILVYSVDLLRCDVVSRPVQF